MNVVIAMDSFKGSISALTACESIEKGIKRAPILKTDDGQYLDFSSAIKYVNEVSE